MTKSSVLAGRDHRVHQVLEDDADRADRVVVAGDRVVHDGRIGVGDAAQRFQALKAWRVELARERNLPAYVIFNDSTLRAIAQRAPTDLVELDGISGIGAVKRERYGADVIAVCAQASPA